MLEKVTIEQLRTLRAVAEEGSFSAAARKLGRVQAAVSQSIDRLEAQLGLRLFDRSGRVPRLTHHGEAIVVDVMFPTSSLADFAKEFAKQYPTIELVLFTEVLSAVTANVRDKHSTWGIALEDADTTDLERRPIAEVQLLPVVASSHPLAARVGALDAAALAESVQIVLGERGQTPDHEGSRGHGVFSPRTWRVVDLATKLALIESGLGWGHMPEHLVRDALSAGRLVELHLEAWGTVAPRRALVLVWRSGVVMGPVARWAIERLGQLCRNAVDPASQAHHIE
jgi:DNA-binding transcriptional LysR family regulator